MNIDDLPDDLLRSIFLKLPISSIKSVLCTSRRWNRAADTDFFWKKIAEKLPIPSKISKRLLEYHPEWQIYNEAGRAKDKIKHFLLNSRTVFLFITNESLDHELDKPFLYRTPDSAGIFYPEALWPESITIGTLVFYTFYPFILDIEPILPICVHDQQGQPIKHLPNTVQYFYLLDRNEGDRLYWIYNGIFYQIICSQQSIHSHLKEKTFQELVSTRVNNFIERNLISPTQIENKKSRLEELLRLIDYTGVAYDKRWLLII